MLFHVKIYMRNEPLSSRPLSMSRCPRGWYNAVLLCDTHQEKKVSLDRVAAQRAALSGRMRLVREKSSGER